MLGVRAAGPQQGAPGGRITPARYRRGLQPASGLVPSQLCSRWADRHDDLKQAVRTDPKPVALLGITCVARIQANFFLPELGPLRRQRPLHWPAWTCNRAGPSF